MESIEVLCLAIAAVLLGVLASSAAWAEDGRSDLRIENESTAITFSPAAGSFVLQDKQDGVAYAEGNVPLAKAACSVVQLESGPFGPGEAIRVEGTEGTAELALYRDSSFAFLTPSVRNGGEEPLVVRQQVAAEMALNLPGKPEDLRALGTAGLTKPDGHPGSYTFLAIAHPESRAGVVAGWLTQDRGNGVLFSSVSEGRVRVKAQIDYGRLPVPAGGEVRCETLLVGHFADGRLGLEQYADCVTAHYGITLPPIPCGYCTWYSSPHGGASDQEHLEELARFAREHLQRFGLDFIQIDDLWQGPARQSHDLDKGTFTDDYLGKPADEKKERWWWGPHGDFTKHAATGPYREGMGKAAEALETRGFRPGLWLMPFAWDPLCDALREHHDYFVHTAEGGLYYAKWAGWPLDMSHPDARDFLRTSIARIAGDWGFRYLKLDGLWTGAAANLLYVNDRYVADDLGEAIFHNSEKTPIECYRDGLKLVREAAGDEVFILGCNVSQNMRTLGASFGLVDAMRVGPDNGPGWDSLKAGPWHGSNRYFLHGRVWHNDPDPVYVRESMPLEHARLLCSWVALTGQLTVLSDWLPELPEERLELVKRILPNHGLLPRPVDLFERELPAMWLLSDERTGTRRDVLGLFNWDPENAFEGACSAARLGLPQAEAYVGFDFWENTFLPRFSDTVSFAVPAGSCRVIALRAAAPHPVVVSTSRHISQGMVDLVEEVWDDNTRTLRGRSRLTGGDEYELRIALPEGQAWTVESVEVSAEGVRTASHPGEGGVRVTLQSDASREVAWSVGFRGGPKE